MRTIAATLLFFSCAFAGDADRLLRVDHYVPVKSAVPAIADQTTQVYVREVVMPGIALRSPAAADRVVLFVHGAGTPGEAAFDVRYQDYSWMAWLANAGFDVFAMDMTGYGRSTRPFPMNDRCNLAKAQQLQFALAVCPASYSRNMTTIASDWNDIGAVVDYVRALRRVEQVSLIGWSLGGPRAGGYASQHPDKVKRLVLLAPAYNRNARMEAPAETPAVGTTFNTQSHEEFRANWDRQTGCPAQYDPAASDAVWSAMIESDPVGATWGTGVRRAPQTTMWGWTQAVTSKLMVPTLAVSGAYDKQVLPARVREFYEDLGAKNKVFADLACSSHNALWEKNHGLLFDASLQWLTKGALNGSSQGMLKLGY
ncbi:MAG: alpha/beta fold hydrolase [Acidobacteriota bacterium]|nr:alpha/beta fold hydrolase [Acidobacteriota bacterium]